MGQNEDVVELWGQRFNIVKKGLDETQVTSFVDGVIKERDQLQKHSEHFSSLTKLAERTVAEADGLAEEIKREATEKGRVEAENLVNKAKEEAKQIVEEKRAEIVDSANEEAKAIIKVSTIRGVIPEPIRVAHLIASGITRGDSYGKA